MSTLTEYYPYRSVAARDLCLAYCDSLAAKDWPVASEERIILDFLSEERAAAGTR